MLWPLTKQPFTTLTPSKCISKRTFTIKSQPSSHTPSITTIPSRTLTLKTLRPALFFPAHISNHAFTRTFKVYCLYPQLPVATNTALAYFSFPRLAIRRRDSREKGENEAEHVVGAGDREGKKEEKMGKLKLDITVI
ncbi:hypothetical protein BCON_0093g00130 [Botryotinia convoluta]|uniref:Uncharacterized protein n=1 Tax=Botryotinia convoluta TaxID=54673 RepID=A0A4Z1I1J1_9HELO|nr:hypothetical protein BCON_0093g00130 [Botryotinia convoluta]